KMLEPLRPQIPRAVLFGNANLTRLIGDFPNERDSHSVHLLRQTRDVLRSNREQEFEVFAAVQGQHQWIECASAAERGYVFINRQGGRGMDGPRGGSLHK